MTYWDKIFPIVWLFAFMYVQAKYQAEYFAANKPAGRRWHLWQSTLYAIALTVIIPFAIYYGWWVGVKLAIIGVIERLALYDPLLNLIRRKRQILGYNGAGSSGSFQDWLENKLPPKFILPLKIGYIIVFVIAVIFIR